MFQCFNPLTHDHTRLSNLSRVASTKSCTINILEIPVYGTKIVNTAEKPCRIICIRYYPVIVAIYKNLPCP